MKPANHEFRRFRKLFTLKRNASTIGASRKPH
jgi:hypothetical protein